MMTEAERRRPSDPEVRAPTLAHPYCSEPPIRALVEGLGSTTIFRLSRFLPHFRFFCSFSGSRLAGSTRPHHLRRSCGPWLQRTPNTAGSLLVCLIIQGSCRL